MLAIIPARMGSKGVARKNLKNFCGKPLIAYTIESALKSSQINDILLTTESDEVASFAQTFGLRVSYMRPIELAQDETPMIEVIKDAIGWYTKANKDPEDVILLQPTSPLRTYIEINEAINLYKEGHKQRSIVSISAMVEHPSECIILNSMGNNESWRLVAEPPKYASRRQDYRENFYFINGAIYISTVKALLNNQSFLSPEGTNFYKMPKELSVDIDDQYGWDIAEALYRKSSIGGGDEGN